MRHPIWSLLVLIAASVLILSCESKNEWEGRIAGELVGSEFQGRYDSWANGKFSHTEPSSGGERVQWDYGDGTVEVVTEKRVTHVYAAPGQYTIYASLLRVHEDPMDLPSHPESDSFVDSLVVDIPEDTMSYTADN